MGDFSVVVFRRDFMLVSKEYLMKLHKNRHCSADSEIAIDRVDDRFYTTGPNLLLLRGAHHVRTG